MSPGQRKPPAANRGDSKSLAGDSLSLPPNVDEVSYVDHFRARVVQDALTEALRSTWLRRAEAYAGAMHKPGDYPGRLSVDQIAANNERLAQKAAACRNHASVCVFADTSTIYEHLKDAS